MIPDHDQIRTAVIVVLLLVASIDLGLAFVMRGEREASKDLHQ